jgi:hypothetical protein
MKKTSGRKKITRLWTGGLLSVGAILYGSFGLLREQVDERVIFEVSASGCYNSEGSAYNCPPVTTTSFPIPPPSNSPLHRSACLEAPRTKAALVYREGVNGWKDERVGQIESKCPKGYCYQWQPAKEDGSPARWMQCFPTRDREHSVPINTCVAFISDYEGRPFDCFYWENQR